MVLLLAYGNFQDRLLLGAGRPPGGRRAAAAGRGPRSTRGAPPPPVPDRASPADLHGPARAVDGRRPRVAWSSTSRPSRTGLSSSEANDGRIRVPSYDEVPEEAPRRRIPAQGPGPHQVEPGLHGLPAASWPRPGRPAPAPSARRRSRIGSSRRACSGSSPGRSTASTEWATAKCCSRSRASTRTLWKHAPDSSPRATGRRCPPGIVPRSSSRGNSRRRPGRSTTPTANRWSRTSGAERALDVIWWACRCHYMTRVADALPAPAGARERLHGRSP